MYRTTGPYNRRDYLKPNYAPDDACVMCNKRPANLCRQCRSVWYCSKHCQQEDRPSHEILCEAFTNQKPRPSPAHKRAICFPPNEEKPQLIWVLCRDYGYGESWDVEDYVGATGGLSVSFVNYNPITNRILGGTSLKGRPKSGLIHIYYRDTFAIDGSVINQSVFTSVSRSMETPHLEWRGPIIAFREKKPNFYDDINLGDFRHIMDFFIIYNRFVYVVPRPFPHARSNGQASHLIYYVIGFLLLGYIWFYLV